MLFSTLQSTILIFSYFVWLLLLFKIARRAQQQKDVGKS